MLNIIPAERIENKILLIRGMKVMLDRDLAELYGVETRAIIQAVKRNKRRFPDDFMFQLTRIETEYLILEGYIGGSSRSQTVILNNNYCENKGKITNLKSRIVTSNFPKLQSVTLRKGGRGSNIKYFPYVFTEQGVAMLSSVLKSERAIEMNIIIMRAFVKIRNLIYSYKDLADEMEKMKKQIGKIFKILDNFSKTEEKDKLEIGFKG